MQHHRFPQVPAYTGPRLRWPAGLTHLPQAPQPKPAPTTPQPQQVAA